MSLLSRWPGVQSCPEPSPGWFQNHPFTQYPRGHLDSKVARVAAWSVPTHRIQCQPASQPASSLRDLASRRMDKSKVAKTNQPQSPAHGSGHDPSTHLSLPLDSAHPPCAPDTSTTVHTHHHESLTRHPLPHPISPSTLSSSPNQLNHSILTVTLTPLFKGYIISSE